MCKVVRMADLDGYTRSFLCDNYPSDGVCFEAEEELIAKVVEPVEKPKKRVVLRTVSQAKDPVPVKKPLTGGFLSRRRM